MTYAQFLAGIDDLISRGEIEPIWWRTARTGQYRALLKRLGVVTDVPRVVLIEGGRPA